MIVKLNTESVKKCIEKLNLLNEEITDLSLNRVIKKLIKEGTIVAKDYAIGAPQASEKQSVVKSEVLENGKSGYIALIGEGAVYEEFGTGDEGQDDPHPMKNNFNLNPYNSGPTIRMDVFDRHYWIYTPMANKPYFDEDGLTHGIPSGKAMYNASKHIRSIKDDIIKKEFNGTIKKFK